MSKRGRLAHVAAALLALSWLDGLTARAGDMRIAGQVVYVSGVPLIDVWVFAIDRHNGDLVAAARSDVRGRVELEVDGTREILVGASSHRFEIQRVVVATKTQFRIVMRVVRDAPGPSSSSWDESVAVAVPAEPKLVGVSAGAIRGRVTDATGVPLAGVRVTAARQTGPLAVKSTTLSTADGSYVLVVPPGAYRVQAFASGLRPSRQTVSNAGLAIEMTVDAAAESIEVHHGRHVLKFKMSDSIDPEYLPPAPVRAWLKYRYCLDIDQLLRMASNQLCQGRRPLKSHASHATSGVGAFFATDPNRFGGCEVPLSTAVRKLKLEKYWWLEKLYTEPRPDCERRRRPRDVFDDLEPAESELEDGLPPNDE